MKNFFGAGVILPNQKTIKRYSTLLSILCLVSMFSLSAQTPRKESGADGLTQRPINIGDAVPDDFWKQEFTIYNNGHLSKSTLAPFRGKLLVLDFWSTTCSPCLIHQKEIAFFKNKYGNEINVVMVNSVRTRDDIQKVERLNQRLKHNDFGFKSINSIIDDDYLHRLFPFNGFPFYVWINQNGNIQTYTMRNLLDRGYNAPFVDPTPRTK